MRRLDSHSGAALVELAIVIPVLLLIVGGIAEFGFLFGTYQVATNAAREGARLGAIPGNEENDYATVHARVEDFLADSHLTGPHAIAVAPEAMAIGGLATTGVRVTVTYTYDCLFLGPVASLINGSFADTITYRTTAVMRLQVAAAGA